MKFVESRYTTQMGVFGHASLSVPCADVFGLGVGFEESARSTTPLESFASQSVS